MTLTGSRGPAGTRHPGRTVGPVFSSALCEVPQGGGQKLRTIRPSADSGCLFYQEHASHHGVDVSSSVTVRIESEERNDLAIDHT